MDQLKVILVGTSPSETIRLEELLKRAGYLSAFRCIGLSQAISQVPDWTGWDLIIARFDEAGGVLLLSLLAPVLRQSLPPVFFLTDGFSPGRVVQLLSAGGRLVLPVEDLDQLIKPSLEGMFDIGALPPPERADKNRGEPAPAGGSLWRSTDDGLARLFKNSTFGICLIRLRDQRCVDCNEGFARLFEFPRKQMIGRVLPDVILSPSVKESLLRGEAQVVEQKIFTGSHKALDVRIHMDLLQLRGEDHLIGLFEDVTEQVASKEDIRRLNDSLEKLVLVRTGALHEANRELAAEIGRRKSLEDFTNQLSQTLRETTDIVAIGGPDGKLQFLNQAGRSLFGLSEEEPVSNLDLLFPYSETIRAAIERDIQPLLIQTGTWRGETEFLLPDGRVLPISQVLLCKKDGGGNVLYYATIARDISDYKRVEQELRTSRERYRNLAEAAHDFIFVVSKQGVMEYANEFACRSLGHDPLKVEGMPARDFFPNEFSINQMQLFYDVHEIDRPVYSEGPYYHDEDVSWLGTWLIPIHDDSGGLVSVLGVSRDITEQKKADEALQKALVNERRLAEIRSNFFSMTSHQFRTPLSTIMLSAELLQKYGTRWDENKRSEHLGRILEASRRLNSMLEDILVIGRVESGRYVCLPKYFDLISFTQKLVEEIKENDRNRHVMVFHPGVDELPVYLDQEVYRRAVDNLLSNAVKYSPAGTKIFVEIKLEDDYFLLEVADQGIGIPEQDLQYLFQPFERGSNASDYPGTGIGLTILQKSVELLNGSISVKSKENEGTTFMVRFPSRLVSVVDPLIE